MGAFLIAAVAGLVLYLARQVIGHVTGHLVTGFLRRWLRKKLPRGEDQSDADVRDGDPK